MLKNLKIYDQEFGGYPSYYCVFLSWGNISKPRGAERSKAYEHKPMPPYVNKQKQEMK